MRGAPAIAAAALALGALGCSEPSPRSCADALAGIWADDQGRAHHITDDGRRVEIHSLHVAETPGSAIVIQLEREGDGLVGHGQRFRRVGASVCRERWRASIARCGSEMTLSQGTPGELDPADCSQRGATNDANSVRLRIRRALP